MSEIDKDKEPKPEELIEHVCPHGAKYGEHCPECEFIEDHIWGNED